MNPKIMKLRGELEKNKGKISDLQGRNRELEKQIRELEDTDIIGMVRENGMTSGAVCRAVPPYAGRACTGHFGKGGVEP